MCIKSSCTATWNWNLFICYSSFLRFIFIIHCRISLARSFNHTLTNDRTAFFYLSVQHYAHWTRSPYLLVSVALHTRSKSRLSYLFSLARKFPVEIPELKAQRMNAHHTIIKSHNWVCFEHRLHKGNRGGKYGVYVNAFISATIAHTINKHSHNAFNAYRIFLVFHFILFIVFAVTPSLFVCVFFSFVWNL